jgi:NADH-quinone oxidoreductase subunit C
MSDEPTAAQPTAEQPAAEEPVEEPAEAEAVEAPAVPEEPVEVDELRSGLLATLESELGDGIVGSHVKAGAGLWVRVSLDAWVQAAEAAKGVLGCEWFDFLSAIDWMPSPFGRYEVAAVDTAESLAEKVAKAHAAERTSGYAGGDSRFQLLLHVVNTAAHHDVFIKADLPDDTLEAPTISHLYAGANWHEREAAEMFGISFIGHPDPRKLYLPSEFEGFPLRKDFPLLARVVKPWPGIVDVEPMPGEDPEPAEGDAAEAPA